MKNMIDIQQEYIDTVNAGMDRWSHRRCGGHSSRIRRGAYHKAYKALTRWGHTDEQAKQIIQDAHDMMLLERAAVDDPLNGAC